jgi:hypothetical protein
MNQRELTQDAYKFFGSPQGELILKDLEKIFGTSSPAFIQDGQGAYCPLKAAVRDGQRSVILHLLYASAKNQRSETKETEANR